MNWSDVPAWLVALSAVGTLGVALRARKTINEVHVLVNSKMSDALKEIQDLNKALSAAKAAPAEPTEGAQNETDSPTAGRTG